MGHGGAYSVMSYNMEDEDEEALCVCVCVCECVGIKFTTTYCDCILCRVLYLQRIEYGEDPCKHQSVLIDSK